MLELLFPFLAVLFYVICVCHIFSIKYWNAAWNDGILFIIIFGDVHAVGAEFFSAWEGLCPLIDFLCEFPGRSVAMWFHRRT